MFDLKSQKSDLSNYIVYMDECLLADIFSRLPVKSVCQMRCVCKSWNSLISSSFFIAHYHHQAHHRKSYLLLKKKGKAFRYALYYPGQGAPFDHITTFNNLSFYPFPFRTRQQHQHLIFNGLIHGVLCLTSDPSSFPTILWNPSLQKYVEIPNSPFQFGLVSDESMFLMHAKNHAVSYAEKQDCDDGKVESCQHILI